MSPTDDTNPNRGRPVLKRLERIPSDIEHFAAAGRLWLFCDEHEGSEQKAADAASNEYGSGVFKVFPSGSWPGGYLRD